MTPDWDPEGMDEAAADPPLTWLAVAVLGVVLAAVGLVATALGLAGLSAGVVAAAPALAPVFDLSVLAVLVGVGLFVLAMTEWDPDVEA